MLARHYHEVGYGAGTPDTESLKIHINMIIGHTGVRPKSLGMDVVPPTQ